MCACFFVNSWHVSLQTFGEKAEIKLYTNPKGTLTIDAAKGVDFVTDSLTLNGDPISGGGGGSGGNNGGNWGGNTGGGGSSDKDDKYTGPPRSCLEILTRNPKAPSGGYKILYKGKQITVKCDMDTKGGGWTLILRDSWKDKAVFCEDAACSKVLGKENHIGSAIDSKDYVGPHLMGTVEGTIPLRTTVETMVRSVCAPLRTIIGMSFSHQEGAMSLPPLIPTYAPPLIPLLIPLSLPTYVPPFIPVSLSPYL